MTRIALTCGKKDGEPEEYEVVYSGYVGEGASTTYHQGLKMIDNHFPREEWEIAKRNLLVMDMCVAQGQYPCAKRFAIGRPSRI